eukprot:4660345-Prymnesium_polylepis.1
MGEGSEQVALGSRLMTAMMNMVRTWPREMSGGATGFHSGSRNPCGNKYYPHVRAPLFPVCVPSHLDAVPNQCGWLPVSAQEESVRCSRSALAECSNRSTTERHNSIHVLVEVVVARSRRASGCLLALSPFQA